jgi:hypothetical protein
MQFASNTAGAAATFGICHRPPSTRIDLIVAGMTLELDRTHWYQRGVHHVSLRVTQHVS